MRPELEKYASFSGKEWVDALMKIPPDEAAHKYFIRVECKDFLRYISVVLFGNENIDHLLGEFFEFISKDNWHVLRLYARRHDASLRSYLSCCAMRYFIASKKVESRHRAISIDDAGIIAELNKFTKEEECDQPPVWQSYERLCKRDRVVLRLLVIEGKSSLDAADEIWQYVKTDNKDWRSLPPKRVQDTIAMLKRRALLSLSMELHKFSVQ